MPNDNPAQYGLKSLGKVAKARSGVAAKGKPATASATVGTDTKPVPGRIMRMSSLAKRMKGK
jgi:hypothetical protein